MSRIHCFLFSALVLSASRFVTPVLADTFGSGANSFDIEFVTIGNPGNPPDHNHVRLVSAGAVPYEYRIGKYEISEQMIDKANALGAVGITKDTRGSDYPATSVTWYEAAQFVNWLNTSTGNVPAYKFDANGDFQLWQSTDPGYDPSNRYRNTLSKYFLPSMNEWHKAAYYDPAREAYYYYQTSSDSVPDGIDFPGDPLFEAVFNDGGDNGGPNVVGNVGLSSPYGTFGQGGNVMEWIETSNSFQNSSPTSLRNVLGGGWDSPYYELPAAGRSLLASAQSNDTGIRIAATVPEPSYFGLLGAAICGIYCLQIRRQSEDL